MINKYFTIHNKNSSEQSKSFSSRSSNLNIFLSLLFLFVCSNDNYWDFYTLCWISFGVIWKYGFVWICYFLLLFIQISCYLRFTYFSNSNIYLCRYIRRTDTQKKIKAWKKLMQKWFRSIWIGHAYWVMLGFSHLSQTKQRDENKMENNNIDDAWWEKLQ